MNPRTRRVVITIAVLCLAFGVVLVTLLGEKHQQPEADEEAAAVAEHVEQPQETPAGAAGPQPEARQETADQQPAAPPPQAPAVTTPPETLEGLHAAWVRAGDAPPQALGSLDLREASLYLELSAAGAGLERITLSGHWQTAAESRQAAAHYDALKRGDPNPPPLPALSARYVLQTAHSLLVYDEATGQWLEVSVPTLAAYGIYINGEEVPLVKVFTDGSGVVWTLWAETAPGQFQATILDGDDRPIALLERAWSIADGHDITLAQRVVNLTEAPLEVQWIQYGPGDLIADRARYMDMRRLRSGYLVDPVNLPDQIAARDNDLILDRRKALKRAEKAADSQDPQRQRELLTYWPNDTTRSKGYELSWFAATNRYFALAVHPHLAVTGPGSVTGGLTLSDVVSEIRFQVFSENQQPILFTYLYSPVRTVDPGGDVSFDLGVYAGPQDRQILDEREPMKTLKMKGLILYQMSAMCAVCTFQWLAGILLSFLSAAYLVIRDWGLAIILLVVVVRTLLHPLTKKAQVNMQRFGKAMGDLKPEIDKLQKKYPNEPKKIQQEQMRLMRERGVNPFQMLGCLPLFLQMPIWVALYAMLYFAFELRHEPAFWGVFQVFWGWPFLADLSAADHCLWEFQEPFRFLIWNVTGINVLPILMGLVFFFQQKYMAPPPSPSMTKEQIQQQKIMKVMMVVLFPVMLYSAPSGLTLYIFTSSLIGIIESRYVRAHVKAMDLEPPKSKKEKKKKKPKDLQSRLYADAMDRAKKRAEAKKRGPPKRYKKRK
jgi:YidC/Oxa1 family membrane protein insertase